MIFWRKKKRIETTFVDVETAKEFARVMLAPERLPDSFEAETTMHLDAQPWRVVTADPMTREEYAKTCTLRLELRRLSNEKVNIDELLYSLPTICDWIPGIREGTSKLRRRVHEIGEDEWRQLELVAPAHRREIDQCFTHVRAIHAETRAEAIVAFRRIHVRKEVESPLDGADLTLTVLQAALAPTEDFDGLAYRGIAGLVENGFAFTSTAGTVFGLAHDGKVSACCFAQGAKVDALRPFLQASGLLLIDWVAAEEL